MVNPVAFIVLVLPLHALLVKLPQVPVKSWNRLRPDPPVFVTVIIGLVDCATKEYQTSRLAAPQPGKFAPAPVAV